ncbi:hypothetical protein FQN54_005235 [Arachnomyces sp. PD_36]|nr:hypothetical protein FQN54_005235 [Arachnomyces sp. PD_36]
MKLSLLSIAILGCSVQPGIALAESRPNCSDPPLRKEWRQLTIKERHSYIDAVHCLTESEPISGLPLSQNRFDDFHAVHHDQTPNIHFVGHFVLWHRYLVAAYEKALREECGYTGGQPYWDWSLDASLDPESTAIFETEVFDPETGFGGNGDYVELPPEENPLNITGRTGGGCVKDGPFTKDKFSVNIPETSCLKRDYTPWIMNTFAHPSAVEKVTSQPDYTTFARAMENKPTFDEPSIHGSGHFGVGGVLGTIGNANHSPGDPLFYLHHGNLDHIFWVWQQEDLDTRLNEVGGPVIPFDYSGKNVTLDFEINLGRLAGNATLHEILDTQSGVLCYDYV